MHAWNLESIKLEEKSKVSTKAKRHGGSTAGSGFPGNKFVDRRNQRKKLDKKRNSKAGVGLSTLNGVIVLLIELLV